MSVSVSLGKDPQVFFDQFVVDRIAVPVQVGFFQMDGDGLTSASFSRAFLVFGCFLDDQGDVLAVMLKSISLS